MTVIKRRYGSLFPAITNDLFDDRFFGLNSFLDSDNGFWNKRMSVPPANISETQNEFSVDLSVPGLAKGDFKVEVDDNMLTISCEKEESREDKGHSRKEFSYHSFSRSFQLPDNVAEDKINAKYDNGVLHITIPKKEVSATRPKKSIDVG